MEAFILVVTLLVGGTPANFVEMGFSEKSCINRMVAVGTTPEPLIAEVAVARVNAANAAETSPVPRIIPAFIKLQRSTQKDVIASTSFKEARCVAESTYLHEKPERLSLQPII